MASDNAAAFPLGVALQAADTARFFGVDLFGWAVIAGIAAVVAVVVPLILHWWVRRQNATVWIIESDNQLSPVAQLGIAIRSDGEPDLIIRAPAEIVIERGSAVRGEPINLKLVKIGNQGFSPHYFPLRISTDDELSSLIQRSALADELWLRDCVDWCWVRGVYFTTRGRPFRSPPFRVPVDVWLPADASARRIKPRP